MQNKIVFNSVADIKQFGDMVVDGYSQVNAGLMPQPLKDDLEVLTGTLIEGMSEAKKKIAVAEQQAEESAELHDSDPDSPVLQAECELYMDMQRLYCDKIPGYKARTEELNLQEY